MSFQLRDYQERSVFGVREAYQKGYKAPLLVLPTGGGKTIVFSFIALSSAQKGKKVLILVHRVELLKQTAAKLRAFGIRVGLISPKFSPDYSAEVQVAMVQTMGNRFQFYPHFDIIITDEAHHAISSTYVNVISYYSTAFQLGVTATPIRTDGKGLGIDSGGVFDKLVIGPSVRDLIRLGFLVEPVVYASSIQLDLTGVTKTAKGDFSQKKLSKAMDKPKITGNAVQHYMDICPREPAVAFCASVAHAETVAADFRANGFKFYALHGKTDGALRERLIRGLGDGTIEGITSCDVISEGTDIPAISAAILLRPTQSMGLYLQQVGRALRPFEGKDRALILDHAGNTFKHGFADDDREWTLEGKTKKRGRKKDNEDGPTPYQCKECYAVFDPLKKICPQCGEVKIVVGRAYEEIEGTLKKIENDEKIAISRQRRKMVGAARSLEELQIVGAKMGYKAGWANHVFKSRQK